MGTAAIFTGKIAGKSIIENITVENISIHRSEEVSHDSDRENHSIWMSLNINTVKNSDNFG